MVKKKRKKIRTGINVKSKKKKAVVRGVITKGKGRIRVNKILYQNYYPPYVKEFVEEPVNIAGNLIKEVDINLYVRGGGFMGQATAARTAIAKALDEYFNDEKLRKAFLSYDRLLLVDDSRRKETKKPLGTGARKHKQKSKR
ncbi:MAG: 30S ribosomal protein S9 [Candidatus ainarchaeum sp.]|nr:30S ribosomal protein S9 [Candidatus ainarchaeum sp.]